MQCTDFQSCVKQLNHSEQAHMHDAALLQLAALCLILDLQADLAAEAAAAAHEALVALRAELQAVARVAQQDWVRCVAPVGAACKLGAELDTSAEPSAA